MTKSKGLVVALSALLLTLLAGCSSSDSGGSDSDTKTDGATIKVGTVTGVLPYVTQDSDGKTLIGFEPELVNEAAKRAGLKVDYTVSGFDTLLVGLESKRFDLVFAGIADTAEREAKYDAIHHTDDKFSWIAKKDLADKTKSFTDMCGKKLALLAGSAYEAATKEGAAECKAAGNPVKLLNFDDDAQSQLAVTSGQIDYYASNLPLLADFVKKNTELAVVGFNFLPGPTALYLQKDSELTVKLKDALQDMVDDGTYKKILDKWDVGGIGIDKIEVNPVSGGTS